MHVNESASWLRGALLAAAMLLGLASGCSDEKDDLCSHCSCVCSGCTIDMTFSPPASCESACAQACSTNCGSGAVSARCLS